MTTKTKAKSALRVVIVVGLVAVATAVVIDIRHKRKVASQAMDNINAELDNLDPVTRAAVVAKIGTDEVRHPGGGAR
jgi:hypothetical protein